MGCEFGIIFNWLKIEPKDWHREHGSIKAGNFLTSCVIISCSKQTLPHTVSK
jgi:hypothetical protein